MIQILEKQDSLSKGLNLSSPTQQNTLNITRNIIDKKKVNSLRLTAEKDTAKHLQAEPTSPKTFRRKQDDILQTIKPQAISSIPEIPAKADIILPEKSIGKNNSDWIVGVIILSLIIIASVRIIFNTYLKQLFNATIKYSTATRLFRERNFNLLHAAFRLDVLFYLILSLFIYQNAYFFGITLGVTNPFLNYLICFCSIVAYFLAKRFVYMLIAVLTESKTETSEYLFNINIYNRVLGILLFPICLALAFIPLSDDKYLILIGLVLVSIVFLLNLSRGVRILFKKQFSISYLILYLCSLEILPLLVIYKIIAG